MPQEHRPHDLVDTSTAPQPVDEERLDHRDALIVDELLRADLAYWQRAGSVDAMLAMVL